MHSQLQKQAYMPEAALSEELPLLLQSKHKGGHAHAHAPGPYSLPAVMCVFFFPALGGLLFGYDIGATSAVLTQLESSTYSGVSWSTTVADSAILQGFITSITMAGALFGSVITFQVADKIGRRAELMIAAVLYISAACLEVASGSSSWNGRTGISTLLLGRMIYGVGCGFAMHGAPAYIGEMSPASIRGLLVSLKEGMIVLGMLLGYTVGYIFQYQRGGWRNTYSVSIILGMCMFVGVYILPPSARWLALKGRVVEARTSLQYVTPTVSEGELDSIRESAFKHTEHVENTDWKKLFGGACKPALIAGCGLVFFQQVTGQPSVLYYADSIFEDVGLDSAASIGVSAFKLVATLVAVLTVDKFGRKKLLYIGCSLMFISLVVLAVAFTYPYVSETDCNAKVSYDVCRNEPKCQWSTSSCSCDTTTCVCCGTAGLDLQKMCILAMMFVYIGGYQVGFGPISWLIISEVFPLEIRGKAVALAVVSNFFWNTVMTFSFPLELEVLGSSFTFFLFAAIDAYAMVFIARRVPETKGMSLEEIEEFFKKASASTSLVYDVVDSVQGLEDETILI